MKEFAFEKIEAYHVVRSVFPALFNRKVAKIPQAAAKERVQSGCQKRLAKAARTSKKNVRHFGRKFIQQIRFVDIDGVVLPKKRKVGISQRQDGLESCHAFRSFFEECGEAREEAVCQHALYRSFPMDATLTVEGLCERTYREERLRPQESCSDAKGFVARLL